MLVDEFIFKEIDQMSAREFFCVERLRINSFVSEQKITDPELDDIDLIAEHVYLLNNDKTCALATCRLFEEKDLGWMIGRVAVSKDMRGQHVGQKMINAVHQYLQNIGAKEIYCHAQIQAKGFYDKLGYQPIGDAFTEAGIEHILMKKKLG